MKQVTVPFQIDGRIISAILTYGDDDVVESWELISGKLNLSKMTYGQVREMTGMTPDNVERIRAAIQLYIDRQEGRA